MASSKDMISRIDKVGLGIARGMQHLHSLNIIFRDLKPHNIGFDENGIVRIFDFGLAREYHPNFSSENTRNEGKRHMTGNCGTPR
jgi:serine/threonine protein kinase